MLSACFSQPLPHFKRFLLRLTGNCFPKQVPLPPAAHSAEGPWLRQRASLPWATGGRGTARRAGPGPAEDKGSPMPRLQWERTKEFQGNSSIFQSQISAAGTPQDALLLRHPEFLSTRCMHSAPTTADTVDPVFAPVSERIDHSSNASDSSIF